MDKSGIAAEQERLNAETARIAWKELQRYFAAGRVLVVAAGLDLVEIAGRMVADDAPVIEAMLQEGQLAAVSDDLAATWYENNADVWAVVVAPWVLVQPAGSAASGLQ